MNEFVNNAFVVSGGPKKLTEKKSTISSAAQARIRERERIKEAWSNLQSPDEQYLQPVPKDSLKQHSKTSREEDKTTNL